MCLVILCYVSILKQFKKVNICDVESNGENVYLCSIYEFKVFGILIRKVNEGLYGPGQFQIYWVIKYQEN